MHRLLDDGRISGEEKNTLKRVSSSPSGRELIPVGSTHTLIYSLESHGDFQGTPKDPGEWIPPTTLVAGFEITIAKVGEWNQPDNKVVIVSDGCKFTFNMSEILPALGLCRRKGMPHSVESKAYLLNPNLDPNDIVCLTRRSFLTPYFDGFFGVYDWILQREDVHSLRRKAEAGVLDEDD